MDELKFAVMLAKETGAKILKDFNNSHILYKTDGSLVTQTDIDINQKVIKKIIEYFPQDNIIGEESSHISSPASRTWVCDPIDGTLPYSLGVPTCVFSLTLLNHEGDPILAVVFDPFLDRIYTARRGEGAFVNGISLYVNKISLMKDALLGNSGRSSIFIKAEQFKTHLYEQCYRPIILHSVIYEAMLVASGKIAATVMTGDSIHDAASAKLIVEEAGGKVTDLFGDQQTYSKSIKGAIITNGTSLHDELVATATSYKR